MDEIIANATSTFQQTTGFSLDSVITWASDHLFKVVLGSGLGLLDAMLSWIIAIVLIGAVVYFFKRMWGFFSH